MSESLFMQAADVVQARTLAVANADAGAAPGPLFTHSVDKTPEQAIRELLSGHLDLEDMQDAVPAYGGLGQALFRAAMFAGPDTLAMALAQAFAHGVEYAMMKRARP